MCVYIHPTRHEMSENVALLQQKFHSDLPTPLSLFHHTLKQRILNLTLSISTYHHHPNERLYAHTSSYYFPSCPPLETKTTKNLNFQLCATDIVCVRCEGGGVVWFLSLSLSLLKKKKKA
ncbi:hypothetical protein OAV88_02880 [bacterium]|nr:hypothetical protein [bacterium]